MTFIAKASYPINDTTYADQADAIAAFCAPAWVGAGSAEITWIDEKTFRARGVLYTVEAGENPIAARRNAGTAMSRSRRTTTPTTSQTDRERRERAYDNAQNEGGEGYNPYRSGDVPTYSRTKRR